MCAVAWNFDRLGPNTPADGDAVRGNFIRESKSAAAIFVRELLQNTLDARVMDAGERKKTARVTLDFITPDVDFNKKLCEKIIPFIRSRSFKCFCQPRFGVSQKRDVFHAAFMAFMAINPMHRITQMNFPADSQRCPSDTPVPDQFRGHILRSAFRTPLFRAF